MISHVSQTLDLFTNTAVSTKLRLHAQLCEIVVPYLFALCPKGCVKKRSISIFFFFESLFQREAEGWDVTGLSQDYVAAQEQLFFFILDVLVSICKLPTETCLKFALVVTSIFSQQHRCLYA